MVILIGIMDFSKCRNVVIRGYNKVGFYSMVLVGIKDCVQFNFILIVLNIIVDVVGLVDLVDGNVLVYVCCLVWVLIKYMFS